MTTIVTGLVIENVTASSGTGTPIPRVSNHMIVLADVNVGNNAVELPAAAEIGDIVEYFHHTDDGVQATSDVYPPGSETIDFRSPGSAFTGLGRSGGRKFVKTDATRWRS